MKGVGADGSPRPPPDCVKAKPANLRPVAPPPQATEAAQPSSSSSSSSSPAPDGLAFAPGAVVQLMGLTGQPQLNGRVGVVSGPLDPSTGRIPLDMTRGPAEAEAHLARVLLRYDFTPWRAAVQQMEPCDASCLSWHPSLQPLLPGLWTRLASGQISICAVAVSQHVRLAAITQQWQGQQQQQQQPAGASGSGAAVGAAERPLTVPLLDAALACCEMPLLPWLKSLLAQRPSDSSKAAWMQLLLESLLSADGSRPPAKWSTALRC